MTDLLDLPAVKGASGPLDAAAITRGELRARIAFWRAGCRRVTFPDSREGLPELEIDTGRVTTDGYVERDNLKYEREYEKKRQSKV